MAATAPKFIAPNGVVYISGGKLANCTLSACPVEQSVYGYRPSLRASGAFIALYGVYMINQVVLGLRFRMFGYMAAMVLGCIDEILGYAGRIMLWNNPWDHSGFIMQIGLVRCVIDGSFFLTKFSLYYHWPGLLRCCDLCNALSDVSSIHIRGQVVSTADHLPASITSLLNRPGSDPNSSIGYSFLAIY